ncbi:MAG: NAD(P)/FAD-dependent oxidoreductase [Deltaproteobacteria bacterium]|nr:NAD(P)/FAD-dependent oxidoreductase [Deltaproteobacteria bacterium]
MTTPYDIIVIGAGHNGLVTAAYLARAGKKVLVLERRDVLGGAAATEEIYRGFKYSTCAHSCGMLYPTIARDLNLDRNGVKIIPFDPILFSPAPGGDPLLIWRETGKTVQEIERFSKTDATNYPRFKSLVAKVAAVIRSIWLLTPPDLADGKSQGLVELLKLGWKFHKMGRKDREEALRVFPMSIADFLSEWFETDLLKGTLGASGIFGTMLGPRAQGTSYIFVHNYFDDSAEARPWGFVRGGMGNLSDAIARTAKRFGAEVRTNAEVRQVIIKNGAATGVALQNGDEVSARAILSSADLRSTLLRLVEPIDLDPHFAWQARNFRFRGGCAKVNLALGEFPNFRNLEKRLSAAEKPALIRLAPSLEYLERASDEAKYGDFSSSPFLEIAIPSATDPSLAPAGQHVMSIFMQYAPYHLKKGDWKSRREELGDRIVDTVSDLVPNLKNSILHRQVLTPLDLEEVYGLTEGSGYHGELSLDQLFVMRPVPGWARYRTPIRNLYLCGSSAHPGGGITGIPGHNAAREVLSDWRNLRQ